MGPPRSSKKRPQANRAYRRVKEISCWKLGISQGPVKCAFLSASQSNTSNNGSAEDSGHYHLKTHRILLLVSSAFPRVSNRTMIAMIMRTAMVIPTFSGVIKLGLGVGVGVAEGGGGAFFAASIPCTYCKR